MEQEEAAKRQIQEQLHNLSSHFKHIESKLDRGAAS